MKDFDVNIGLEVHVQLITESKMFCGCANAYGGAPNTHVCPVCLGYPGAMPVLNQQAIQSTLVAGLMIDCTINRFSKWDRKSYFYPDMPKNYQLTQYDLPLCVGGHVDIEVNGESKRIRVNRIHLEEDVGKSMHFATTSGVDYNRAGVPLMEIVSEADMTSADEAGAYLVALRQIMLYAGVSDCDLERGNMRCDVNCSLRPKGSESLGTKTEVKNMNTIRGVQAALKYEIARQAKLLREGGSVVQETLRWDPDRLCTESMRSKEDAHDYRYFPEPDLLPVTFTEEQIEGIREALPELPAERRRRFVSEHGLPDYDAGVLVSDKGLADYFEAVVEAGAKSKLASNWVMTEVLRVLGEQDIEISGFGIAPASLAELVKMVEAKEVNSNSAKDIFGAMLAGEGGAREIAESQGKLQVSDDSAIDGFVDEVIAANEKAVTDYRAGEEKAAKFLVGQVMRLSKGQANPEIAFRILKEKLDG